MCVLCAWSKLERAISTHSSTSASVHLQRETHSSLMPEVLITGAIHDCLQCDSYLEVSISKIITSIAMNEFD